MNVALLKFSRSVTKYVRSFGQFQLAQSQFRTGAGGKPLTWFPPEGLVELAANVSSDFLNFRKKSSFFENVHNFLAGKFLLLRRLQDNSSTSHVSKHTELGRKKRILK